MYGSRLPDFWLGTNFETLQEQTQFSDRNLKRKLIPASLTKFVILLVVYIRM